MKDRLALSGLFGFTLGILLGSLYRVPYPFALFLILLAAGFFSAWFFGRRDTYLYPALVLLFLAIGLLRMVLVPQQLPNQYGVLLGTPTTLSGVIVSDPDIRETGERVVVSTGDKKNKTKILAVVERYSGLSYGDTVRVTGTLTLPEPFETDGGREFAYDKFLAKDGIFAVMQHARVEKTGESSTTLLREGRFLYSGKHLFTKGLEAALPEPHASLAAGLITGGKQGLGKDLLEAFTIAGLLPIIVLSGYNVMIVAEAVFASLAFLPKRFALATAAGTVILFVLAAGGGASAFRALIMALLALFARATGRTYDAIRALVVVFVSMLLFSPLELVYDPGFQFSFAATLGLIIFSTPLQMRLLWVRGRVLREVVATTLAAQLFVLPLLLYQTGNLSLIAVPANILVLPSIPFAMAASAIAGIAGLAFPTASVVIALPAYALLSYVIGMAEFFAHLPFAHLIIPAFPAVLLVPAYLGIGWLVRQLQKTAPKGKPPPVLFLAKKLNRSVSRLNHAPVHIF